MINIHEFLEVYQTEDVLDWWTQNKLPHPGCPVGFKIVQQLVIVCHNMPIGELYLRRDALRETLNIVSLEAIMNDTFIFNWKGQNRKLIVPMSDDWDYKSDNNLLSLIYS